MDNDQADRVKLAVLQLAVVVRDEGVAAIACAARGVLAQAGGDPIAALTVAAALIRVDQPLDEWWLRPTPLPLDEVLDDTVAEALGRQLIGHGTHAAHNRHRNHGEQPCTACVEGERAYQRARHVRRNRTDQPQPARRTA